jgi:hypothetical protein
MQFVHLGRRTGTLLLSRGVERAMIGFHVGKLVSAQAPRTPKLGDLLVSGGSIDRAMLDGAIAAQGEEKERRSLGQILIGTGAIGAEALRDVIGRQIEQAVAEVMVWDNGTFEFAIDDLRPIDDIALYPSDVLPDADINTQMVLLEAARIFDERSRGPHATAETTAADSTADWQAAGDSTHPSLLGGDDTAISFGNADLGDDTAPGPGVVADGRPDAVRGGEMVEGRDDNRSGVARLRRVFGDLRSGLISATVALNLMHIISESVERAVLFLVKRDQLVALGAFGSDANGRPLAELTRAVKLPLEGDNALIRSLETGEVQTLTFEDADLPDSFRTLVGRPRTGQVVIFPVLGTQRVISVIYADNGDREEPVEDIDILELATAQVGMAFENELLRRQISQNKE